MALAGAPWRTHGLWHQAALGALRSVLKACLLLRDRERYPDGVDPVEARRAYYDEASKGAPELYFEPRAQSCPLCGGDAIRCTFVGNSAEIGGAVYAGAHSRYEQCLFAFNEAGGAMYCHYDSYPSFSCCNSFDNGAWSLTQETNYPWDGNVKITVRKAPSGGKVHLRIPEWATGGPVRVNGRKEVEFLYFNRILI